MANGPRWFMLALLASLGGNMFLGGYMLGHRPPPFGGPPPLGFFGGGGPPPPHPGDRRGDDRHGPPPPNPMGMLERLLEQLPSDDAAKVRAVFEPHIAGLQADETRRRDFLREVRAALADEPFNREAFEAILARNDESERLLHDKVRGLIVEAASVLSPEGRRRLSNFGPK